jgi:hypothetical protein
MNVTFTSRSNEEFIVIGCSKDFTLYPKKSTGKIFINFKEL